LLLFRASARRQGGIYVRLFAECPMSAPFHVPSVEAFLDCLNKALAASARAAPLAKNQPSYKQES